MRITAIYSTERKSKSTTYNLAQTAINELRKDDEVYEFFLPRDMNHFCRGCFSCFEGHHEKCGGYEQIKPIVDAIDKSELIIFTTPVYAYHVPGQMKAFLDHFAYRWLVHQPNGEMTKKQALVISTAAGAGMKTTVKDIKNRVLKENDIDIIYSTSAPYTDHLIGLHIKKITNKPWIADFRDPWIGNDTIMDR